MPNRSKRKVIKMCKRKMVEIKADNEDKDDDDNEQKKKMRGEVVRDE
jgi:hypothetical protein